MAALTPRAELDGNMGDSHMGLQARLMSQAMRKLTGGHLDVQDAVHLHQPDPREDRRHVRQPGDDPGGRALKFYTSVRLDIRRIGAIKDSTGRVMGNRTRVKVVKNKVAPPFTEAEFDILYAKGISWEGSVLDSRHQARARSTKRGSWLSFDGEQIGQGHEARRACISKQNPELTEKLIDAVKEKVAGRLGRRQARGLARERRSMTADELREMYLSFFESKGHAVISGSSLIPENDPTVLFTTAGMHPLVPYLLGEPHPAGKRLCNCQKCIRTGDIDEVGDASHLTFFEMLGNWSLGDYFKEEAIAWSYEFLTSTSYLGFRPGAAVRDRLRGQRRRCRGTRSRSRIWQKLGHSRGAHLRAAHGGQLVGAGRARPGPAGRTRRCSSIPARRPAAPAAGPGCSCGKYFEIWNDVFMQYEKTADGALRAAARSTTWIPAWASSARSPCCRAERPSSRPSCSRPIIDAIAALSGTRPGQRRRARRAPSA